MSGSSITQGYHGHYQDGEQRHLRRQSTAALIACPFPQADQAALPVLNRKVRRDQIEQSPPSRFRVRAAQVVLVEK